MGKELSTQTFIIAMAVIFLAALSGIGALFYILNKDVLLSTISYSPVSKEPSSFNLQINAPEDNSLIQDPNLIVSGKTVAFAVLIITNGEDTAGFEADKNGEFSKIVTLKEGPNVLRITSFDKQGGSKMIQKQVYYTKEAIDEK